MPAAEGFANIGAVKADSTSSRTEDERFPPGAVVGADVCRFCGAPLALSLIDLGTVPLANSFLTREELELPEPRFPLQPRVCEACWLVQLPELEHREQIFCDYAYFSSFSSTWLDHCRRYCARVRERFALDRGSLVIEAASNDGYLLQFFTAAGVPVLGVEPAENVAAAAEAKGIPTLRAFFGETAARELVREGRSADLFVANNVLAHVPDLNDFVRGIEAVLTPTGVATVEIPHLLHLLAEGQFDTIYHEHFSYFSLGTLEQVFGAAGLRIFDVEEIPTHGGSLRIYACRAAGKHDRGGRRRVRALLDRERAAGLERATTYRELEARARQIRSDLLDFLEIARRDGVSVAGYGAPAKGNTLLCYCGVGPELLPFTVDRSPYKQGLYLPGTHIPIRSPEELLADRPDYVLILPWNLKDEIVEQMHPVREWGGRFVTAVPRLEVVV